MQYRRTNLIIFIKVWIQTFFKTGVIFLYLDDVADWNQDSAKKIISFFKIQDPYTD